jgi:hypothetical protein
LLALIASHQSRRNHQHEINNSAPGCFADRVVLLRVEFHFRLLTCRLGLLLFAWKIQVIQAQINVIKGYKGMKKLSMEELKRLSLEEY